MMCAHTGIVLLRSSKWRKLRFLIACSHLWLALAALYRASPRWGQWQAGSWSTINLWLMLLQIASHQSSHSAEERGKPIQCLAVRYALVSRSSKSVSQAAASSGGMLQAYHDEGVWDDVSICLLSLPIRASFLSGTVRLPPIFHASEGLPPTGVPRALKSSANQNGTEGIRNMTLSSHYT